MKIKLLMDQHKTSETAWCGSYEGVWGTLMTMVRGWKYGYRRFYFGSYSKG